MFFETKRKLHNQKQQARKVPVQRLADTIAGKFTWLVFAMSASTVVFWGALSPSLLSSVAEAAPCSYPAVAEALGGGPAWSLGARLAVDVCLVACPCSLGLATPTAIMVSLRGCGQGMEAYCIYKGHLVFILGGSRVVTALP